ncbi:hypothetical protein [Streptomyces tanashiensis]|uniref:Secreted protein n=1 Tax=Streptomyces tanashiensis TaxID=67367 RepID=A0ABY6QVR2_9ACTN|nr:hypothetical protein [Streptomyces tanashiensis]UZX21301.1 hypothetical protein LDH80_11485 [Streptomyces tanashiensis]GGY50492.1 hypothetical protein GCM10010299_66030 [Streptomyces tanashiensis]
MPALKASARRVLTAAVLAAALGLPLAPVAYAEECKPDDQACLDKEANAKEAKEIEEQQKKTEEAAGQADKDIKAVGKKLDECPPGSASCMGKLTSGKGAAEEKGVKDMTDTISAYQPEPADNAQSAVTSTCADFPGSLPQGSTDPGQSPFPVSQLCSLLGS